jgi:hypothetical protein
MSDDEQAETEPAVELGTGPTVEGAPLARVASRLTWPIERRRLLDREGDTEVRTPDGPRTVATLLEGVDTTYFDTRRAFVDAVETQVGPGPVQTADSTGAEPAADTE